MKAILELIKNWEIFDFLNLSKTKINDLKFDNHAEKIERNLFFLYDDFLILDNLNTKDYYDNYVNYVSEVYNLINYLRVNNKKIYYCDPNTKEICLKTCFEVMKFFHRHKTFCELYHFDIKRDGKILLKSLIRKLNKIKNEDNEENDDDDFEEINGKKACFILINNCYWKDLLDINIYSILDSNSSFIIIYDKENEVCHNENRNEDRNEFIREEELIQSFPINIIENISVKSFGQRSINSSTADNDEDNLIEYAEINEINRILEEKREFIEDIWNFDNNSDEIGFNGKINISIINYNSNNNIDNDNDENQDNNNINNEINEDKNFDEKSI